MAQQSHREADTEPWMSSLATRFSLAALLAMLLVIPAAAEAAPPQTPALTGTTPTSPGLSTTPRVKGFADGVSPQAVHVSGPGSAYALVSAVNPGSTITIYADDPTCSEVSAVAGSGLALEFENSGIEVAPVETDAVTTFYADQSDISGTSGCSAGFAYRQVTGPPAAPSLLSVTPASPADDNTPRLIGSAEAESTVTIYVGAGCTGSAVASGTSGEFAEGGIQASVPDNSTTTFSAAALWAGLPPVCAPSTVTYQELTQAPGEPPAAEKPPLEGPPAHPGEGALPAPHLRILPGLRANDNTPLVSGGAASGAANVRVFDNASCAGAPVAKGPASQLAAGFQVEVADNTTTRYSSVAYDKAGHPSTCSAAVTYTEDSTPPLTRITLGPGVKTRARKPVFRFTDITEETGTSFFCRVDKGPWKACQTPWHLPRLRRAGHIVRIKAVDAAGNAEATAAKRRFKVVAHP